MSIQGSLVQDRRRLPAARANSLNREIVMLALASLVVVWFSQIIAYWQGNVVMVGTYHKQPMFVPSDSVFYRPLRLLGTVMFAGAGLLAALAGARKKISPYNIVWLIVLFAASVFWFFYTYSPDDYVHPLVSDMSPAIFLMCLGMFVGVEEEFWAKFKPLALGLAHASAFFGAVFLLKNLNTAIPKGISPACVYLQTAFWFGSFSMFTSISAGRLWQLLSVVPVVVVMFEAVLINNRSWVVIAILALLLRYTYLNSGNARFNLSGLALKLVWFLALVSLTIFSIAWLFPEQFTLLLDRLTQDTRSGQYRDFFDQVPVTDLIFGAGPLSSYSYKDNIHYEGIDNQLILLAWKFGAYSLIAYLLLVILPGIRLLASRLPRPEKGYALLLSLWLLSSAGLSIFHMITQNPQNLLMVLVAGRCLARLQRQFPGRPFMNPV